MWTWSSAFAASVAEALCPITDVKMAPMGAISVFTGRFMSLHDIFWPPAWLGLVGRESPAEDQRSGPDAKCRQKTRR